MSDLLSKTVDRVLLGVVALLVLALVYLFLHTDTYLRGPLDVAVLVVVPVSIAGALLGALRLPLRWLRSGD